MATEQKLFLDAFSAQINHREYDDVDTRHQRMVQLGRVESGMSILDVGTGTGKLITPLLERMNAEGHICGIDLSISKLRIARAKRFPTCVRLLQADIHELDHADGCYHRVFCHSLLPYLPDRPLALGNIHRMLKQGGMLLINVPITWHKLSSVPYDTPHEDTEHTVSSSTQIRELLERAGFTKIEMVHDPECRLYRASRY